MTGSNSLITPDMQKQILQARSYFKIAKEIENNIIQAGIKIDDLSVAYSTNIVALSGIAQSQDDINKAEVIAGQHPEVKKVSSSIYIR